MGIPEQEAMDVDTLWKESEPYFFKMCGFSRDPEGCREQIEEARVLRDRWKDSIFPKAVLLPSKAAVLREQEFSFSPQLEAILEEKEITQVVFYGLCLEDSQTEGAGEDFLEQFYLDAWKLALLYAGQDWLRNKILEETRMDAGNFDSDKSRMDAGNFDSDKSRMDVGDFDSEKSRIYVSDSIGPGYYGLGLESVTTFFQLLPCESIGMKLVHGSLWPAKSAVGFYLVSKEDLSIPKKDCKNCLAAGKSCEFCKNSLIS
jgi:hypothetical protein